MEGEEDEDEKGEGVKKNADFGACGGGVGEVWCRGGRDGDRGAADDGEDEAEGDECLGCAGDDGVGVRVLGIAGYGVNAAG